MRKAGVLTYTLRQSNPPHTPPKRRAYKYTVHPRASVNSSMGKRAQASTLFGSFHLSSSQSPNTHCPKNAGKNFSLAVHEIWL